jgi:hypothetical protein
MLQGLPALGEGIQGALMRRPIIDPATGQPTLDPDIINRELLRRDPSKYAPALMPYLMLPKVTRAINELTGGAPREDEPEKPTGPTSALSPTSYSPDGAKPGNITGGTTIASLAANYAKTFGGTDASGAIVATAKAMGLSPSAKLDHDQIEQASEQLRAHMLEGKTASAEPRAGGPNEGETAGAPATPADARDAGASGSPGIQPGRMPVETTTPALRTAGIAPTGPVTPSGRPVPPEIARSYAQAGPAGPAGRLKAPEAPPLADITPQQALKKTQEFEDYAQRIMRASPLFTLMGAGGQALQKEMYTSAIQKAQQYREFGLGQQKLDPQEQEAKRAGYASVGDMLRDRKYNEGLAETSKNMLAGLRAKAGQYQTEVKHYTELARNILNQPGMYTGAGGDISLMLNRVGQLFGVGSPEYATLQEAFKKITSASVLSMINNQRFDLEIGGDRGGRIFQQQVQLVGQASPQMSTTKNGNRFLVNTTDRLGQFSVDVARLAREYVGKPDPKLGGRPHGVLDPGFDDVLEKWLGEHPIFTKQEQARPALLGAPDAPAAAGASKEALYSWFREMGLGEGEAYRLPNGEYRFVGKAPKAK